MAVTHGMNTAEVESLAVRLREAAGRVEQISGALEREVHGIGWRGPDAERYRSEWWPGHRRTLQKVAEDLRGFGQSAENNAKEQRDTSTSTGGQAAASGIAGPVGTSAALAGAARTVLGGVATSPTSGSGGGNTGSSTAGGGRSSSVPNSDGPLPGWDRPREDGNAAYRSQARALGVGAAWQPGGSSGWECTAWVNFRLAELRAEMGNAQSPSLSGDGAVMAGMHGGSTSTLPEPGAVISDAHWNHVMIAERVTEQDGKLVVNVSEFNFGEGYRGEDGFRNDRVLTRYPDGAWHDGGSAPRREMTVANLL